MPLQKEYQRDRYILKAMLVCDIITASAAVAIALSCTGVI